MINKGYLVRLIAQTHFSVSLVHLYKGKLMSCVRQIGAGQRALPVSAVSQLPSAQINPYARVVYLG